MKGPKLLIAGAGEKLQYLAHNYNDNTIRFIIKYPKRLKEEVYEELSAKEFLSLMKSPLTGVKTMFPFRNKEHSYLKTNYVLISKELFLQARQKAKKIEATANDILLTACYRSYALLDGVQESDAMSIMSMMDLRQHCKENESLGLCNMSGSLPTLLKDGVWGNFSDTLKEIVLQTKKAKEDPLAGLEGMPLLHGIVHTMPMWLMLQAAGLVYSSLSLSLTNLGNISCQELAMDGAVPIEGIFAGPLKKKPSMQISAASFDGTPALAVVGDYTKEDALLIQSILDGMVKEITDYIAEEK